LKQEFSNFKLIIQINIIIDDLRVYILLRFCLDELFNFVFIDIAISEQIKWAN